MLTPDARAEILSRAAERRDVGRIIVAVAGWYACPDACGGTAYTPTLGGPWYSLDEAVDAIVSRARRERRERRASDAQQPDQEVAGDRGEVRTQGVTPATPAVESP